MTSDALHERFRAVPVVRWLGAELRTAEPGRVEVHLPIRPEFLQADGLVQGGVLAALADLAAAFLHMPSLQQGESIVGTSASLQFLAAVSPTSGPLLASATPLRTGRTVVVAVVEVVQDGALVAHGTFPFLRRRARP